MKITINTGMERKISINYQTWSFSCFYTEEVDVDKEEEARKRRHHLRALSQASVYTDILTDMGRLRNAVPDRPDFKAQLDMLEREATDGLEAALKELKVGN